MLCTPILQRYCLLADIEATACSLNGEMGLRSVYHSKRDRIRVHVLDRHAIPPHLKCSAERGIHDSWTTLWRKPAYWVRQTAALQAGQGHWIETRQDS